MEIVSSYSVRIKEYSHIFDDTIHIYRQAVSYLIQVLDLEWNTIKNLWGKNKNNYIEKLIHKTSNNKAKYESLYKNNGFDVIYDKASLKKESNKIIGLFNGVMAKTDPRAPSLEELTAFSLDYLDNDEGFFLMVEGARIDKESHSHQTEVMFQQLLGFDRAVETAQRWAEGRDDTIIVVTADHETGGLYYNRSIATQKNIVDEVKWLTSNHSRTRVDIAIYGDISRYIEKNKNRFSTLEGVPYWDNTDVFRICCEHLNSKY